MKCLRGYAVSFLLLFGSQAYADIAVIKSAGSSISDEVRNGFTSTCFENRQEFSLQEDLSNQSQIIDSIRSGNIRLILAVGSASALLAKSLPNLPLLFCLVLNPERSGLTGGNIFGIPLQVPVREQFGVIREINKKWKRIGVIYTRPTNEPLLDTVRKLAESQNLMLIQFPIRSSMDLEKVMNDMVGKCDVIWIPPDPSLNSDEVIKYIGATSLSRQIPFVGPNERYVKAGAIFTVTVDPVETGRIAGEVANQILAGAVPSKIPAPVPQRIRMIINKRAAGLLHITFPKNIEQTAAKVYQ
jgi:putative tryptophan/tyrosine transport system substrate-binding protein